jgi:hypothetical protein
MVTVTLAPAQTLVEAREGFIGAVGAEYGAAKVYAGELMAQFGSVWVDAAHDAPGADMDLFRVERAELYKGLKAAGHSNPSVKLKQIKDHARAILARESAVDGEDGEGAGEGEGAGGEKKERRSVQLRMVEELIALYKFAKRSVLNEAQANAFRMIGQALRDLGVNPEGIE